MKIDECIEFAQKNPICFLATSEGKQPHVRALLLFFADQSGFYFGTLSPKDVCKQLRKNPKVEVCFYNKPHDFAHAKQMRLMGEVEFVTDPELKHRIHEERLYMDDISGTNLETISEVFKIGKGNLHFWTMSDVLNEKHLEHLVF